MMQRTVTGICLALLLAFTLWLEGPWFSVAFMITLCFSLYEIYHALAKAGHRPIQWPCWLCLALSIPLFELVDSKISLLMPLVGGAFMLISVIVIFRDAPKLEDILMSAMPLVCALLPGMCMLGLQKAPVREHQMLLTLLAFGIPLMGDTIAYFVGSYLGRHKLCPAVSPNKTVEGAVAGLTGSVLFSMATCWVFPFFSAVVLPPWWHFLLLGFLCGIAGQIGDLFASLIKRHCGIKDYSNIFPGHGGMMDRLDSVYWATVILYVYLNLAVTTFGA